LSPHEAALLATVLPNPSRLRAHDPGPYARERSAEILELMNWHRDKAIGTRLLRIASEGN
jgi:membrane peptidoglycan carboxypeptidase